MAISPLRRYKTIFFDLDGTLLPIDMEPFLKAYFQSVKEFMDARGYDGEKIIYAVNEGVQAMLRPDERLNEERFWETFERITGESKETFDPLFAEYYTTDFNKVGELVVPDPSAASIVKVLKDKGYQLFLTTMPLFPRVGVEARLKWAGIEDASVFDRITTYDNSHSTKPYLSYYEQNIALAKGSAEEILMVGNNTLEDLACCELGADGFLVTDWLLNPNDFDYSPVKHGSLADFLEFAKSLPECE